MLPAYPADRPLWAAGAPEHTLAALHAEQPRRSSRFAAWLALQGIILPPPASGAGRLAAIEHWLSTLPWGRSPPPSVSPAHFYATAWPAEQAPLHTALTDLGLTLGAALCACRPGLAWGVDRFEDHAADGDPRFGRVVVLDPALPATAREPVVYDAFDAALMAWQAQAGGDADAARPLAAGLRALRWAPPP